MDPERIERIGTEALKILWRDGHESFYPFGYLRSCCPCAACREFPPGDQPTVTPLEIQPVGRYALTIRFSDGHTTGIFSFDHLRRLCRCEACLPQEFTEG